MTNQEAIKMLTAKVECMQRETSGTDIDCNLRNCDDCELCYAQGTTGEQRKALNMAISALQEQDSRRICNTCKHNPPSKKWPCVDCDMREPTDRWEAQEVKKSRCTYKPDCPWYDGLKCNSPNDHGYHECDYDRGIFPESYEENVKNSTELSLTQKGLDTISRQDAIDEIRKCRFVVDAIEKIIGLPSAQPEPLTDKEQRIFLAAMGREEKVCEEVDRNYVREPYEDSLVRVCKEIRRKVKGALWI